MKNKPFIIGITGNIASGKSVVRQYCENLGAVTFDADLLAHRTYLKGKPTYQSIVDTFGTGILDTEAQIDRKKLGRTVFQDPIALEKLEAIVHPAVIEMINTLLKATKSHLFVVEAVKLIEAGLAASCDQVWVVAADDQLRLQRLIEERHMSIQEAKQRIESQTPQAEKIAQADQVIYTERSFKDTYDQVYSALYGLKSSANIGNEINKLENNTVIRPLQICDEADWLQFQQKLTTGRNNIQDIHKFLGKKSVMGLWQAGSLSRIVSWKIENLLALMIDYENSSQLKEPILDLALQDWLEYTTWQHLCTLLLAEQKILLKANFNETGYQKLASIQDSQNFPPIKNFLAKYDNSQEQVFYKKNQDYEFGFF